jgi:hypothetical protein
MAIVLYPVSVKIKQFFLMTRFDSDLLLSLPGTKLGPVRFKYINNAARCLLEAHPPPLPAS